MSFSFAAFSVKSPPFLPEVPQRPLVTFVSMESLALNFASPTPASPEKLW
ncbi:hypothetical protein [uncultured Mitsuokella sp.]|nr:hypothetical protein [uncultured Mitsuokella sp.]